MTSQRSSIPSTGCNSGVMLDGVVRLEAILPDMSFQTVRISAIPIMSTPLSNQLLSKRTLPTPGGGEREGHPLLDKTGYLTMNQTRQLLPLLEDDSCVSHVPVVGLWVKLRPSQSQLSGASALRHPFCWAACVRYLSTAVVQKRVFVASGTFLLVILLIHCSISPSFPPDHTYTVCTVGADHWCGLRGVLRSDGTAPEELPRPLTVDDR